MKQIISKVKISKAKFEQVVIKLQSSATRDRNELSNFINAEKVLTELNTKLTKVQVIDTDRVLTIELEKAATAKNLSANKLRQTLRTVAGRVGLALGTSSAEYRRLVINRLNYATPAQLVEMATETVAVVTPLLTVLAENGLTQENLNTVIEQQNSLRSELLKVSEVVKKRRQVAQSRVTLINDLFKLSKTLSNAGKLAWYGIDQAKYKDYVLDLYKKFGDQADSTNLEAEETA